MVLQMYLCACTNLSTLYIFINFILNWIVYIGGAGFYIGFGNYFYLFIVIDKIPAFVYISAFNSTLYYTRFIKFKGAIEEELLKLYK
jgi:hypothetical protein